MATGDLDGRVAIITGAGMGIGQSCALALARAGAHVVLTDIDAAAGEATCASLIQLHGRRLAPPDTAPWVDDTSIVGDNTSPANLLRPLSGNVSAHPWRRPIWMACLRTVGLPTACGSMPRRCRSQKESRPFLGLKEP